MESDSLLEEDANLARFRRRYNNLSLIFKLFFLFQFLAIAALIIYLVHDAALESDRTIRTPNPLALTSNPQSQISALQTAAEELDDVVSLILFNYSSSNSSADTDLALKNCSRSLQNGSVRIREAVEADALSDEMVNLTMVNAGEDIRSCLDDLEKVESTAAGEVRARVIRVQVYLSGRGESLLSYDENAYTGQKVWSVIDEAWNRVLENLFLIFVCGLQLLFIFYLLWTLFKFR